MVALLLSCTGSPDIPANEPAPEDTANGSSDTDSADTDTGEDTGEIPEEICANPITIDALNSWSPGSANQPCEQDGMVAVEGDVWVVSGGSLSGLSCLCAISGNLYIDYNDELTSLQGLDQLQTIGGMLGMYEVNGLASLEGAPELRSVGSVFIRGAPLLTSISALQAEHIGILDLYNTGITTFADAPNIEIGTVLKSISNDALLTYGGLGGLTPGPDFESLHLEGGNALTDLSGATPFILAASNTVSIFTRDTAITDLSELAGITSLHAEQTTIVTSAPTDLTGLADLEEVHGSLYLMAPTSDHLGLTALHTVTGDLSLFDIGATSLEELSVLREVGGQLLIRATAAGSLSGLENLTSAGMLNIYGNESMTALAPLTATVGTLALTSLPEVSSLTALSGLTIQDGLMLNRMTGLSNMEGLSIPASLDDLQINSMAPDFDLSMLEVVTSVGTLYLSFHETLTDLSTFSSLVSVDLLYLRENPNLTSVDGLENITALSESLYLEENDTLTDLGGLANLRSVGDGLRIRNHAQLTDLSPLLGIESVGGVVDIEYNRCLTASEAEGLVAGIGEQNIAGEISLDDNDGPCQ